MGSARLEAFLARLYTDARLREAFLQDREGTCRAEGLEGPEVEALQRLDGAELRLAAHSFEHKRASVESHPRQRQPWWRRLLHPRVRVW